MVNASTLSDYEVFFFLAALSFTAFIGFLVAFIESIVHGPTNWAFFGIGVFTLVVFGVFLAMAIARRSQVFAKGTARRMRATDVID